MNSMRLIQPGTKVVLSDDDPGCPVIGTIDSAEIFADGSVTYCVSWWEGSSRDRGYFNQMQFEPMNPQLVAVAFYTADPPAPPAQEPL